MKLFFGQLLVSAALAQQNATQEEEGRKVPNRTPLQRLETLQRFGAEWSEANLSENQAQRWVAKINANSERMRKRYSICGWFDVDIPHGGPNPETRYINIRLILAGKVTN